MIDFRIVVNPEQPPITPDAPYQEAALIILSGVSDSFRGQCRVVVTREEREALDKEKGHISQVIRPILEAPKPTLVVEKE